MDSGEDKLTDDEYSSPSKSRFGRTHKPKISEDFCYINNSYSPLKVETKLIPRRSKSPQKLNKPQIDVESNLLQDIDLFTNAPKQIIPLKTEVIPPPVFIKVVSPELNLTNRKFFKSPKHKDNIEEPIIDVNKVMKIVSTKTESEAIVDTKTCTKPVLKTYCNKRKSLSKPIVESFGLPDLTIIPEPENRTTIPKRIQELDVEINSDDVTIDNQLSRFPWESDNVTNDVDNVGGIQDILSKCKEGGSATTPLFINTNKSLPDVKQEPKKQKSPGKSKKHSASNAADQLKESNLSEVVCIEPNIDKISKKKKKPVKLKGKGVPKYKTKSMKKFYNFLGKQRRNERVLRLVKKLKIDMNVNSEPVERRLRNECSNIPSDVNTCTLKSMKKSEKTVSRLPIKNHEEVNTPYKKKKPKSNGIGSNENIKARVESEITLSPERSTRTPIKTPKKSNLKFQNKLSPRRTRSISPLKVAKDTPPISLDIQKKKDLKGRKYLHTYPTINNDPEDVIHMSESDVNISSDLKNNKPLHMRCSVMLKRCDELIAGDVNEIVTKKTGFIDINLQKNVSASSEGTILSTDSESDDYSFNKILLHQNRRRSNRIQNIGLEKRGLGNKDIIHNKLVIKDNNKLSNNFINFENQGEETNLVKQDISKDEAVEESQKLSFVIENLLRCSTKIKHTLDENSKEVPQVLPSKEDDEGKHELSMGSSLVILSDGKEFEMSENGIIQNSSVQKTNENQTNAHTALLNINEELNRSMKKPIALSSVKKVLSKDEQLLENNLGNVQERKVMEKYLICAKNQIPIESNIKETNSDSCNAHQLNIDTDSSKIYQEIVQDITIEKAIASVNKFKQVKKIHKETTEILCESKSNYGNDISLNGNEELNEVVSLDDNTNIKINGNSCIETENMYSKPEDNSITNLINKLKKSDILIHNKRSSNDDSTQETICRTDEESIKLDSGLINLSSNNSQSTLRVLDNNINNSITKENRISENFKSLSQIKSNRTCIEIDSDKPNIIDSSQYTPNTKNTVNNMFLCLEEIENITFESDKKNSSKRKTKQTVHKNSTQHKHVKENKIITNSPRDLKKTIIVIDDDLSIQETQIEEIVIESSDDELPLKYLKEKLKHSAKNKIYSKSNMKVSSKKALDENEFRQNRKRKFIEELSNINDDVEFIKQAIQDSPSELKRDASERRKPKSRNIKKINEVQINQEHIIQEFYDNKTMNKEIKKEKLDSKDNIIKSKENICSDIEYIKDIKNEDVGKMMDEIKLGTYKFIDGDLAYARLGKFPFWPCMIVVDPSIKTFIKKCAVKAMICPFYHVRFFGDKGRRSWVRCNNVMPLEGPDDFNKCIDYLKKKGEKSVSLQPYIIPSFSQLKWKQGFKEAMSLLKCSVKERYAFFSDLFEKMETQKNDKTVDQNNKLSTIASLKEVKKEEKLDPEVKANKSLSKSPKISKFKKQNDNMSQTYSLRARQRKNSESLQTKNATFPIPASETIQKHELAESIKTKSNLDISSDSSDSESFSKWSVRTPVEMTQESQIALYKRNNLFKGVPRERVCQICFNPGEILKCKGKCFGYYHKSCALTNPIKPTEKVTGEKITNELTGSEVEVVLVRNKKYQEPSARLCLDNNDSAFKTLSLAEQIDMKLKEVMSPIVDKTVYADSTTDYTSSEESSSEKSNDTSEVIEHVTGDDIIVIAKPIKKRKNTKDSDEFKCTKCQQNKESACHVCGNEISPNGSEIRQRCTNTACGKFFHRECLKVWPQTQFSISKNKESELYSFCCPMHVCHICVSDDPRQTISRLSSDKVVKCLKCPATYHSNTHCIPAGTNILTTTQIICPRHLSYDKPAKATKNTTINTKWCFICSLGGDLICCETCPTSVHAECSSINLMDDDTFICEDCETGRLPLYDEIVWVKLGSYRWWPALTLFPNDVPHRVMSVPHLKGEFVVRFFGTHDHYWVGRGRAFLFQEGDAGPQKSVKNRVEWVFQQAIEEAAQAFTFKNNFKKNREDTLKNDLKPPPYIKIKVNKPVGNVKLFDGNVSNTTACNCDPKSIEPCGADSYCLNRLLLTECDPEVCPAGEKCENQRFEKRQYPQLEPYKTNARGWGLKTLEPIKKGQFVIEYVGEIIDDEEYQRRIRKMHEQKEDNYYFLTIDKDRMIDAGPKGNVARFMNHCCQPNCETQKWTVKGDTRVGLFASQDIPGDTEVTFNYNLECAGEEKKVCRCGAPTCSGFIGLKAKNISDDKKTKRKVKKKRSPTPTIIISKEPCFVCGKFGDTFGCHNKICTKYYHLKCVNLEEQPDNKWSCPWHNCNLCTKRTIRCCVKCLNSFCPVHSEGNVRYDKLLGFICTEHDPTKEPQEVINGMRSVSSNSPTLTEESDVTSTTTDIESQWRRNDKSRGSLQSEKQLKKNYITGKKRNRSTRNSLTSRKRVKLDGTLVDNTVNIVNNVTAQKELLLISCSKDPKDKSVQEN